MFLKPKNTNLNPPALLYKRFTVIEQSSSLNTVYKTLSDNKIWTFDCEDLSFLAVETEITATNVVDITPYVTCLSFLKDGQVHYFYYTTKWEETNTTFGLTLLSATFNNIGKYQTNKYYFAGSFDYIKKGAIEGSTTQYIKGNIIPLEAFSIQHFNDYIKVAIDDLVVIKGKLYTVQNPIEDHKHQPNDYAIYTCDLISVL